MKLVGLPNFSVLRNAKVQMVEKIGGIEPLAFFARPMVCTRVMDTPNTIVWCKSSLRRRRLTERLVCGV